MKEVEKFEIACYHAIGLGVSRVEFLDGCFGSRARLAPLVLRIYSLKRGSFLISALELKEAH